MVKRYYIYLNHHNRRTLVEKCDFISAYGWGQGGADARTKWGLKGGGPELCLTPLGVFDFEPETKKMRLKYLHPGITVEEVIENTGFELIIPPEIPLTPSPTENELTILRQRVDPLGHLR
jgi:glutaconate CoA-transferase subunit B